jgi:hypothetical protein
MRYQSVIAISIILLTGTHVAADTAISGVVLAAQASSGKIIIQQAGTDRQILVHYLHGELEQSISPGLQITARGNFRPGKHNIFDAKKLEPGKKGRFIPDPTGVRKRLNRGFISD